MDRLADISCIDCGHWVRMHGNGIGSCAVRYPHPCDCSKFQAPQGDESAGKLVEKMLRG